MLVRDALFTSASGSASFVIARSLPQGHNRERDSFPPLSYLFFFLGDATFNYIKSRLVPVNYYWKTLEQIPYVVVLSLAAEDLVDVEYDSRTPPGDVSNEEKRSILILVLLLRRLIFFILFLMR